MSTLFTFLGGFFKEGAPESSQRLITIFGTALILGVWARLCLLKAEMLPFSESVLVVLTLILGSKLGAKYIEGKSNGKANGNGNGSSAPAGNGGVRPPA